MAESGEEDLAGWDEACRREAAIRDLLNRYPKRLRFDDFLRHSSPGFRRPGILLLPRAATIFSYSAAYFRMFRPDVSFQTAEKNGTGTILRSKDSATGSIGSKSVTRLRANQGTALRPASTVYPRDCRLPKTPSEAPAHPAAIDRPPSQRSREFSPATLTFSLAHGWLEQLRDLGLAQPLPSHHFVRQTSRCGHASSIGVLSRMVKL